VLKRKKKSSIYKEMSVVLFTAPEKSRQSPRKEERKTALACFEAIKPKNKHEESLEKYVDGCCV
jgi:hypothetical protein